MAAPDVSELCVAAQEAGLRLDTYVAQHLSDCSRSYAAVLIRRGNIQIDGIPAKASHKLKPGERITIQIPVSEPVSLVPEPMALDILFEDQHLIIVNKPAGLVVHPAAGHASGTLVHGILHHCPDLEGIGGERRPGIVHRLDKDTSGALVVAKTSLAHHELTKQFKARSIEKRYLALVQGIPDAKSGMIDLPVGRHPVDRKKMSTLSRSGREALTYWRIQERFKGAALLAVDLKTGRTHQIRVHCQAMGHPIIGDTVYGPRRKGHAAALYDFLGDHVHRQLLHALQLRIDHPVTRKRLFFEAPLPIDMSLVLQILRNAQ